MAAYYAVLASLPLLSWGERPPFDYAYFDDWVANSLEPGLRHFLTGLAAKPAGDPPESTWSAPALLGKWRSFNSALNQGLAHERAARLGWHGFEPLGADHVALQHHIHQALDQANPLETEKALENLRWRWLESAEAGHYFAIENLICWYLKLGILLRLDHFGQITGHRAFQLYHERIAATIPSFHHKEAAP